MTHSPIRAKVRVPIFRREVRPPGRRDASVYPLAVARRSRSAPCLEKSSSDFPERLLRLGQSILGVTHMAETLPYMNSTGLISKILDAIKVAETPDRFSVDYLSTVLGYGSGSARPFISLAKRLGLINSDGTPSALYRRFRGTEQESMAAMAEAIRKGYAPLYKRNQYAHKLDNKQLSGHIREITGMAEGNSVLRAITGSFNALKKYADFETSSGASSPEESSGDQGAGADSGGEGSGGAGGGGAGEPLRFGYTINVNLPDTNDITVFNAIFKSMKEHLL